MEIREHFNNKLKSLNYILNIKIRMLKNRVAAKTFKDSILELQHVGLDYMGGTVPDAGQKDWYVFSTVRNERIRLPYFLQYYREMGARLFIIADNQSQDKTAAFLLEQPDVLLFQAKGRYSESRCGVDWLNAMLHIFGQNRWCLTVDADELLVFPHCEHLKLIDLTNYLDSIGATALPAFLLDMYSEKPVRETVYQADTPFVSACPFFDSTGYLYQEKSGITHNVPSRGGPRHRLFWKGYNREKPSPFLPKIPLVRWSENISYEASTHRLANIQIGDVSGALLHFKFFSNFVANAEEEVNRQEHFNNASQYATYHEVFSRQPDLCAFYDESMAYKNSHQLMEIGLIRSSVRFDQLSNHQTIANPTSVPVKSAHYNKFIIIGNARTGTTYLETLLRSHPQIVSRGEVFHLLAKQKNGLTGIINDPIGYVNKFVFKPYPPQIKAAGYKIVYSQLGADNVFLRKMDTTDVSPKTKEKRDAFSLFMQTNFDLIRARQRFADYLVHLEHDRDVKVIHLKRRNKLETLLSKKLASRSGAWNSLAGSYLSGPIYLDFKECLEFFKAIDSLEKKYDSLFQNHDLIEIFYDDLIKNTHEQLTTIQAFLCVSHEYLNSPLKKQNTLRASEAISNYFKLKEMFEDTEWINYFEE